MVEFTVRISDVEQVKESRSTYVGKVYVLLPEPPPALMQMEFVRFYQDSEEPNVSEIQVARVLEYALLKKAHEDGIRCRNNMVELPLKKSAEENTDRWIYRVIDAFRNRDGVTFRKDTNATEPIYSMRELIEQIYHDIHNDQYKEKYVWYVNNYEVKK